MSSMICEAQKIVQASRSKVTISTEWYERKLHEWRQAYKGLNAQREQELHKWRQAYEGLNAQHEAVTAKLREDNRSLNQLLGRARDSIKAKEQELQLIEKRFEKAERAKIVEDKLLNLKEKSWDRRGVTGPVEEIAGPENEISNQTQDHRDSLISSREQRSQRLDNGRQIPQIRRFDPPASPPKITPAPTLRKRSRSENGRDRDIEKRNCKAGREEEALEEIDKSTIIVKTGEGSM